METKLAESIDNAIGILAMLATFSQYSHHNKEPALENKDNIFHSVFCCFYLA